MQRVYEKQRLKVDNEMNFVNVNLENMTPEEKQIFDRGLAIVNCKEDTNSLFKVMAFNHYDSASR